MKRKYAARAAALLLAVLTALTVLTAAGCWDMHEINRRVYVLGIGVDRGEREGDYAFTLQTANVDPETEGSVLCATVESPTLAQALRELDRSGEDDTTLIHLGCVLLGDSVRGEELLPLLGCLFETTTVRRQCVVAAAAGSAREIMEAPGGGGSTALEAATMIEKDGGSSRRTDCLTLSGLYTALSAGGSGGSFVVPRVALARSAETGETSPSDTAETSADAAAQATGLRLDGANVYDDGRYTGSLNAEETELARLFSGTRTSGMLVVAREDGGQFCWQIKRSRCRTRCERRGDSLAFDVRVSVRCVFADWRGADVADKPDDAEAARALEKQLTALAERAKSQLGAAPLGLESTARRQHWRWYSAHSGEWSDVFKKADISIAVECVSE